MIWTPRLTVAAIAIRDGRFLMVEEHGPHGLVINQPAGHVEDGESLIDAVVREVHEETTMTFVPESVTGLYRWRHPDNGLTFMRVCFAGHVGEEDPAATLDSDIVRTRWLDHEQIAADTDRLRSPMVLRCIDDYRSGQRFPLSLLADLG